MYEDVYDEIATIEYQLNDMDTPQSLRSSLSTKLRRLYAAVEDAPVTSGDPLIDKWERELEQGIIPDLDE